MSTTVLKVVAEGLPGRTHDSEMHDVRSPAQRQAILAIVDADDFVSAFPSLGFGPELSVSGYQGPFAFGWFTSDGAFHIGRMGKNGQWLHRSDHPEGIQER